MIPDSMQVKLKNLIVDHEDYKPFPYTDTVGKITIGIGYNLTDRGLPDSWINAQYDQDVNYFYSQLLADFPWFKDLCEARQCVLIDMCFMGYKKFKEFDKMLAAIKAGDFKTAADEIINSEWATEVKKRATQDALIMLTGIYNLLQRD